MSLSERLAEAAAARASGAVRPERAPRPIRRPEPVEEVDRPPVEPGVPAPCPDCGGAGYLEHIDLGEGRQHERCRSCGTRWSRPV